MQKNSFLVAFIALLTAVVPAMSQQATSSGTVVPLASISTPAPATSLARVISRNTADIATEINGVVTLVPVLEGQRVSKGDRLFELDCRQNKLTLEQSDLTLKRAMEKVADEKVALDRSNELLKRNAISTVAHDAVQSIFDLAQIDANINKVARDTAMLTVSNCTVIAPFSGVITKIYAAPGGYLTSGALVLRMVETENLEIAAQLTPAEIDLLSVRAI